MRGPRKLAAIFIRRARSLEIYLFETFVSFRLFVQSIYSHFSLQKT